MSATSGDTITWHAIAYEHRFVPDVPSNRDIDLAVTWGSGALEEQSVYNFAVCPVTLGDRSLPHRLSPFSGITGVAHPVLGSESTHQEEVLERTLAHQMNLIISQSVAANHDSRQGFVVSGPLLPKLVGRLAYRYYDPNLVLVLALDADERRLQATCPRSGCWEKHEGCSNGRATWFGPAPELSLDATVRSFEVVFSDRRRLLVEVPCCALPSSEIRTFFCTKISETISEIVLASAEANPSDNNAAVPPLLKHARLEAQAHLEQSGRCDAEINWLIKLIEARKAAAATGESAMIFDYIKKADLVPALNVAASTGINLTEVIAQLRSIAVTELGTFFEKIDGLHKLVANLQMTQSSN